jgi:hypothetical protein
VIGAGSQTRHGCGGQQQQLVCGEKLVHTSIEVRVALAQGVDFRGGRRIIRW